MNKFEAQGIMNATLSLNDGIGRIDNVITNMPDGDEKALWIQKLGDLIGYVVDVLQVPIIREYPDLDPYLEP